MIAARTFVEGYMFDVVGSRESDGAGAVEPSLVADLVEVVAGRVPKSLGTHECDLCHHNFFFFDGACGADGKRACFAAPPAPAAACGRA
jgi:hypothetical protein